MRFTDYYSDYLTTAQKRRGGDYHRRGFVHVLEHSAERVLARVRGRRLYQVELLGAVDQLSGSCTCPDFQQDQSVCKHIWATFLTIDDRTPAAPPTRRRGRGRAEPVTTDWRSALAAVVRAQPARPRRLPSLDEQLVYHVDLPSTLAEAQLAIQVGQRRLRQDGTWGKARPTAVVREDIATLADPDDREILTLLAAGAGGVEPGNNGVRAALSPTLYAPTSITLRLLALLCRTGRCYLQRNADDDDDGAEPLTWDDGPPWALWLELSPGKAAHRFHLSATLRRDTDWMPVETPTLILTEGALLRDTTIARLDDRGGFAWIELLRRHPEVTVPRKEAQLFLDALWSQPDAPPIDLPADLRYEDVALPPQARLTIRLPQTTTSPWVNKGTPTTFDCALTFDYGAHTIEHHDPRPAIVIHERRQRLVRDVEAEARAAALLANLRLVPSWTADAERVRFRLAANRLAEVTLALIEAGFSVDAGGPIRRAAGSSVNLSVTTGIDWLEVRATGQFGDQSLELPALLAAIAKKERLVRLGDGSFGLLPEEWLEQLGHLSDYGQVRGDVLRYRHSQTALLDALLANQPEVTADARFAAAREQLRDFDRIQPRKPATAFQGELRGYQRDGLGWLKFLEQFRFGGCLADDMGLGKTVQVLAHLSHDRPDGEPRPSLVVAPRSLVFHWLSECKRFLPEFRVLDHTGADRVRPGPHLHDYDLVVTTYGTLRRDATHLAGVRFRYCILDEAQAIKNERTATAKVVRLVQADHRLALSGTPIENHLGELWSLFEFLNPGLLGSAAGFKRTLAGEPDAPGRDILRRVVRPFVLRRTKEQVVQELPPKVEETLYCELEPAQRKLYVELRDHYRASIAQRVETVGMARSKIHILEALLRLRQAAIHPGLLDSHRADEPSAKLELLRERLAEVIDEGHKALVFSQFTTMLGIVRRRLDQDGVRYAYLDGRTRKRDEPVRMFQEDPECRLFLISLKAGGLGLNLTAADYVFLLDPWWNPAVEMQAIDRAHRIGQLKQVFAYRLIARDTIEDKIVELQGTKRQLADSILSADKSLVQDLSREDLELLLS